jgi:hypothetical protein
MGDGSQSQLSRDREGAVTRADTGPRQALS